MNIKDRILLLINEFSFKDANDVDYVFSNVFATFDHDPKYTVTGKTHGLLSHAIKHVQEFDKSSIDKEMHEITKIFEENKDKLTFIHRDKGNIAPVKIEDNILLNSIDYINDKIKQNKSLTSIEKSLQPILKRIGEKYKNIIELIQNHAVSVENKSEEEILSLLKTGKTIYFKIKGTLSDFLYINTKESIFMVESKGSIKTLFRPSRGKIYFIDKLSDTSRNAQNAENPNVLKALQRV